MFEGWLVWWYESTKNAPWEILLLGKLKAPANIRIERLVEQRQQYIHLYNILAGVWYDLSEKRENRDELKMKFLVVQGAGQTSCDWHSLAYLSLQKIICPFAITIGLLDAINMSRGCEWLWLLQVEKIRKSWRSPGSALKLSRCLKRIPTSLYASRNLLLPSGRIVIALSIKALFWKSRRLWRRGKRGGGPVEGFWLWQFSSSPLPSLIHFWSTVPRSSSSSLPRLYIQIRVWLFSFTSPAPHLLGVEYPCPSIPWADQGD